MATFEKFITACCAGKYTDAFDMAQKCGFSATHSNRSHALFFSIFDKKGKNDDKEEVEDLFEEYETLLQELYCFLDFLNDLTVHTAMLRSCLYDDLSNLLDLFKSIDLKISNTNAPVSFRHDFKKLHELIDERKKTLLFYFLPKMNKVDPGIIDKDDEIVHARLETLHRQSRLLKEATDCLLKIK
jgi:hypothetical protein